MARRRHSNRRRRRGNFGFLYKLLSVLVICAAVVMALTLFFRVDTIEVTGTERYTEKDVIAPWIAGGPVSLCSPAATPEAFRTPGSRTAPPGTWPRRTNGPIIRHFWQTENTCPGRWRKLLSRRSR